METHYNTQHSHNKHHWHILRNYENTKKKLIRTQNKRNFLLRCRSTRILPGFIQNLKWNIGQHLHNNTEYNTALHKFKVSVLNIEISNSIQLITTLSNHIKKIEQKFKTHINNTHFLDTKQKIENSLKKFFTDIKNRQINKFNQLTNKHKPLPPCPDKWIKNISDHTLPNNVTQCLSLGPKFNFTQESINNNIIFQIIKNTEHTLAITQHTDTENIRDTITKQTTSLINQTHKTHNKYTQNINIHLNNMQKETHKYLQHHKNDIIITTADKGNTSVIMNLEDYTNKATEHLNDDHTYKRIKTDPTLKLQKQNNDMIKTWLKDETISDYDANKLYIYNAVPPKIYFKPKIHKDNTPLRPIVSCIDSPTYRMSKMFAKIISNVVGNTDYNITNSFEFTDKIKQHTIPHNNKLVSLDVISLYTTIPVPLALSIINQKWNDIKPYTSLTKLQFQQGIKFCLTNTYFQHNTGFYQQIEGCAMGSPISSVIANLVMEDLETTCLTKLKHTPPFYYRYVDDIITTYPHTELPELLNTFNNYNTNLQFTLETENNNKINFLDTTIIKTAKHTIITDWYQKPTNSGRYISYLSNHPKSQLINTLNNTIDRALKLSHPIFREKNIKLIIQTFQQNHYPLNIIKNCIKQRTDKLYNTLNNTKNPTPQNFITLPYHNHTFNTLKQTFKQHDIQVAFTTNYTNNKNFSNLKCKTNLMDTTNVVYSIPCGTCDKNYIGTTKQKLKHRITQHKSNTKLRQNATALSTHTHTTGHIFNYNNTKILEREPNTHKRLTAEMLHIQTSTNNNINKKTDTEELPHNYKPLLNHITKHKQHTTT